MLVSQDFAGLYCSENSVKQNEKQENGLLIISTLQTHNCPHKVQ